MQQLIKAPAWIEIDSGAVIHNLQNIKEKIEPKTKILAVVKADAYGHGAEEMARVLVENGVHMLAVTFLQEAIQLRKNGITAPILIFAPLLPQEILDAIKYDLTITIGTKTELINVIEIAKEAGKIIKVHLKIETGMGRTGFFLKDLEEILETLKNCKEIDIEGIYTHFSNADNKKYTEKQYLKFIKTIEFLEENGIQFKLRHCCNSTATILYPNMHLDMVRIGTLLYGQKPATLKKGIELKNSWSVKTRILAIRNIPKGHYIGYGRDFKTKRDSKIAVIPIGYADGYTIAPTGGSRSLVNLLKKIIKEILFYFGKGPQKPVVYFKDKVVPVVGRVGMQLSMLDVTDINDLKINDEITLNIRRLSASYKLPRVYKKDKKIYKVRNTESFSQDYSLYSFSQQTSE